MQLSLWLINCFCHWKLVGNLILIICQSWCYSLCLFQFHCAWKKYVTSNYWCLCLTLYGATSSKYCSLQLNTRFDLWRFKHWLIILNACLGVVFLYFSISSPMDIVFPVSLNDVEFISLEVSVAFSVDASCSRLFMSYLSVLSNRFMFDSSCQGCIFFLLVFPLQAAYHHLSWWSCIFRVSSCWLCIVCNWFLSHLFLVFLYHLWIDLFHDVVNLEVCCHFARAYRNSHGIYSCCCWSCSWQISTVFCCLLISLFWFYFQYYFLLWSGRFVVVHHWQNYPYHTACCWHCQLW